MELYISFFLASVLLSVTPGPDNLFVLVQSAAAGARVGIVITLGLCTGLIVHTSLVAFGVAELIAQTHWALPLLALFGACYLSYLAWMSWQAGRVRLDGDVAVNQGCSLGSYYWRGVLMNIANPKVLLFFLAFLPQFVQGEQAVSRQIYVLGGLFIVAALLVFSLVAIASDKVKSLLTQSSRAQHWLNKGVALIFVAMAARLLWMAIGVFD